MVSFRIRYPSGFGPRLFYGEGAEPLMFIKEPLMFIKVRTKARRHTS